MNDCVGLAIASAAAGLIIGALLGFCIGLLILLKDENDEGDKA